MTTPVNLFPVAGVPDAELAQELQERGVSLSVAETRQVAQLLGRDPSIVELYIFNGEWSEHCSYKSSRKLLKKYLPTEGPTVIMGPGEDAGILLLAEHEGKRYGVVVAHESHNHPSQVLPVEGAATGIGGVVRDVNCMGGHMVGLLDLLRFGDPNGENKERTRWILQGVVQGIMEYGNALGVPNLGGDVAFNANFDDNCLVNVMALGILEESEIISSKTPKEAGAEPYDMVLIGKPTDFSGFGGAAFASTTMDEDDDQANLGAIQVHDPFLENVLVMGKANQAAFALARKLGVKIGFKDLGAAGVACAAAELAESGGFGCELHLDWVHTALDNLPPEVICLAETQERFLLVCPSRVTDQFLRIYNEDWELPRIYEGAAASIIGKVTVEPIYNVLFKDEVVAYSPIHSVTQGILYDRESTPSKTSFTEPAFTLPDDITGLVMGLVAHPNVCSRRAIFEHYDTEVLGNAVFRSGEADAGLIAPLTGLGLPVGIAVSGDGNPHYGLLDAYWGGAAAVAESVRNVIAIGAEPIGLTDCLNYGNPQVPEHFAQLERGVQGLADAARGLTLPRHPAHPLPFVSGNVSLYNHSVKGIAIPPSPIVGCIGRMDDISKAITPSLKAAGNVLYLFGERRLEFGGSLLYQYLGQGIGGKVPTVDFPTENAINHVLLKAIQGGYIQSCHDISEGGVLMAALEMGLMGRGPARCGLRIDLTGSGDADRPEALLFSESGGFLAEIHPDQADGIEERFRNNGLPFRRIGETMPDPVFQVVMGDRKLCSIPFERLRAAWAGGLDEILG